MPQPIPKPPDVPPRQAGKQSFSVFAKARGRFAYHLQLPLDRRNGHGCFAERLEIKIPGKFLDHCDGIGNVAE